MFQTHITVVLSRPKQRMCGNQVTCLHALQSMTLKLHAVIVGLLWLSLVDLHFNRMLTIDVVSMDVSFEGISSVRPRPRCISTAERMWSRVAKSTSE